MFGYNYAGPLVNMGGRMMKPQADMYFRCRHCHWPDGAGVSPFCRRMGQVWDTHDTPADQGDPGQGTFDAFHG